MDKNVLVIGSTCVDVIIRVDHLPHTEENLHPVSYTHLDVYKRQMVQYSKFGWPFALRVKPFTRSETSAVAT